MTHTPEETEACVRQIINARGEDAKCSNATIYCGLYAQKYSIATIREAFALVGGGEADEA